MQAEHDPVKNVQAVQFPGQTTHLLFPGLYYPVGQVIGFTQAVPSNAVVELHPHFPALGVFVINDVLQAVQKPVLLQVVQFDGHGMHLFAPSLY